MEFRNIQKLKYKSHSKNDLIIYTEEITTFFLYN